MQLFIDRLLLNLQKQNLQHCKLAKRGSQHSRSSLRYRSMGHSIIRTLVLPKLTSRPKLQRACRRCCTRLHCCRPNCRRSGRRLASARRRLDHREAAVGRRARPRATDRRPSSSDRHRRHRTNWRCCCHCRQSKPQRGTRAKYCRWRSRIPAFYHRYNNYMCMVTTRRLICTTTDLCMYFRLVSARWSWCKGVNLYCTKCPSATNFRKNTLCNKRCQHNINKNNRTKQKLD